MNHKLFNGYNTYIFKLNKPVNCMGQMISRSEIIAKNQSTAINIISKTYGLQHNEFSLVYFGPFKQRNQQLNLNKGS